MPSAADVRDSPETSLQIDAKVSNASNGPSLDLLALARAWIQHYDFAKANLKTPSLKQT